MNGYSSFRRAALCAGMIVFLLSGYAASAQQLADSTQTATNSTNAVAGLRAFSSQPALFLDDANQQDAQNAPQQVSSNRKRGAPSSFGQFLKNIARDQAGVWTSPLRIHRNDLPWLIPFAGATAAAIATDARAVRDIDPDATYVRATRRFTITGYPVTLLGASGITWLIGRGTHNEHLKETGALSAEAVVNSMIVVDVLKVFTNRERPDQGSGEGHFWPHGFRKFPYGRSFPSGHAAASWAFARVIAGEYPKPAVKIVGYSLATLVSMARVTGRKHFPSDALVGGMFGYLIGGYVLRHHASGEERAAAVTVVPFSDTRTHSRGIAVWFTPELFLSARSRR